MTAPKVFGAINAVQAAMAEIGISKSRKNQGQNYQFRGIDEVMNALAPVLVDAKLAIFPRFTERQCEPRATAKGGVMWTATVRGDFDFVSTEDGSIVTATTYGEAQDSADKATNKAMSAAFKYACFQAFCIPTEGDGDHDADAVTPEPTRPALAPVIEPPEGWSQWALEFSAVIDRCDTDDAIAHHWRTHKRMLAALETGEPTIYASVGKGITARKAIISPKKEAA
jgi:hypothetical protein